MIASDSSRLGWRAATSTPRMRTPSTRPPAAPRDQADQRPDHESDTHRHDRPAQGEAGPAEPHGCRGHGRAGRFRTSAPPTAPASLCEGHTGQRVGGGEDPRGERRHGHPSSHSPATTSPGLRRRSRDRRPQPTSRRGRSAGSVRGSTLTGVVSGCARGSRSRSWPSRPRRCGSERRAVPRAPSSAAVRILGSSTG